MFRGVVTDVFFDLDHTLWDFDKNSGLTFGKILADHKVEVDLPVFLGAYEPVNLEFWKYYRENRITKSQLRYQRLKKTFDILGVKVNKKTINQLAAQYIEHLSSFNHLLPDTREVLEYLRPNYKLHIITNGFEEVQEKKLRNSDIRGYFEHIINSEMAGVKKPDPYIFKLAMRKAGVTAQKSLMIGDSIEADILGARAAGLHTLHFCPYKSPEHDYCQVITQLSEIKTYL